MDIPYSGALRPDAPVRWGVSIPGGDRRSMLMTPPRCWRNRTDCEPLHSIEGLPEGMTDDDFEALAGGAMDPVSFVCAGCVVESERALPQDAYRVCWKNDKIDEIGEYDEQDLTHQVAVLGQALAVIASRRVNGGMIDVPTMQAAAENITRDPISDDVDVPRDLEFVWRGEGDLRITDYHETSWGTL